MARMPYPGKIYPGETYPGVSQSYITPNGEWEYVSDPNEQRAVLDAFGKTTFSAMVENPTAGSTYTVDIGGVPGFYNQEYFDGSEVATDLYTPSWVSTPDDSVSILSAETVNNIIDYDKCKNVKIMLTNEKPINGTRSLKIIPTNATPKFTNGTERGTSVAFRIPAGASGAFSLTVRIAKKFSDPVVLNTVEKFTDATRYMNNSDPGEYLMVAMLSASASERTVYLHLPGTYDGGEIVIDELMFVTGESRYRYFDGSTPDDEDIIYSWEGEPHASRSYYEIVRSLNNAQGIYSPLVLQSLRWKHSGNYSLRLLPNSVYIHTDQILMGMELGKTYTISCVRMMKSTVQTATDSYGNMETGNLSLMFLKSDGTGMEAYSSNVPANAGVERLSITFTMPKAQPLMFLLTFNGAPVDVWFDSLMISDGVGVEDYFDGDSPGATWLGGRYTSPSHVAPVAPRSGGYPLKKFVSAYADRMGEIDQLVARMTYLPADVRHEADLYGLDLPGRAVPLGATSDLVDARTADDEWMPWIGQILGIDTRDVSADELRTAITSGLTGMVAGTRRAIASAVRAIMTGSMETRSVRIYPHTISLDAIGKASEWDLLVVTPVEQGLTQDQVRDAVERASAKPAGVLIHHVSKSTTWADLHAKLPTWAMWNDKKWESIEEAGF